MLCLLSVSAMSKLRFNITMSLDGYVAGPNQSVENPLGEGALHLHDWALPTKTFRSLHGDTTFFFVTDGIESALAQARKATRGKDVALGGGANVFQQYFAAGLIDQMEIHVVPLLLGGGERLFVNLKADKIKLQPIRTIAGPGVTHLKYRVLK